MKNRKELVREVFSSDEHISFIRDFHNEGSFNSGIVRVNNQEFYFKFEKVKKEESLSKPIQDLNRIFPSPVRISSHAIDKLNVLSIYEVSDKVQHGYKLLRSSTLEDVEKIKLLQHFFSQLFETYKSTAEVCSLSNRFLTDILFSERFLERFYKFYGAQGENFHHKFNDLDIDWPSIILLMKKYSGELEQSTLIALCHGDLHDLNFSYDWYFWDIDLAGFNPIVQDLSVLIWYCSYQDDFLLPKYKSTFFKSNACKASNLNPNLRGKRNAELLKLVKKVEQLFIDNNIAEFWEELTYCLLCRALLVQNILNYEPDGAKEIMVFCDSLIRDPVTVLEDLLKE